MVPNVKVVVWFLAALLVVAIGLTLLRLPGPPGNPIVVGRFTVATPNPNVLLAGITNQSDTPVVYLVCPPEVKSNGVWQPAAIPSGKTTRMSNLAAGQSGTVTIAAPPSGQESRVPVLWGYAYSTSTPKWRQLTEDALGRLSGHNPRGRGALYTNYVTDIRP